MLNKLHPQSSDMPLECEICGFEFDKNDKFDQVDLESYSDLPFVQLLYLYMLKIIFGEQGGDFDLETQSFMDASFESMGLIEPDTFYFLISMAKRAIIMYFTILSIGLKLKCLNSHISTLPYIAYSLTLFTSACIITISICCYIVESVVTTRRNNLIDGMFQSL